MTILISVILALLLIGAGVLVFFASKWAKKKLLFQSLSLRLLLVRVPKGVDVQQNEKKDPIQEINLSTQLFTALLGLKIPFSLEIAVHHVGEEIHFYLAVPERTREPVSRQIHGFWPDAVVEEADDYNIFNSAGEARAAYLIQQRNKALPIRTFEEAKIDTFLPILSSFSKLQAAGEGLAFQVMIKPAGRGDRSSMLKYLEELRKGKTVKKKEWKDTPLPTKEDREITIQDDDKIKLVQQKLSKQLFDVNARVVASASDQLRTEELLNGVLQSFNQFDSPIGNSFKAVMLKNPKTLIKKFIFREFDTGKSMVLNGEELGSIFHFPTTETDVPRVKSVKSRESAPPQELSDQGILVGKTSFRGEERDVLVSDDDRRRHIYIIGQTGTGKSSLLTNMAEEDIKQGKGVAVIDPHGDLIDTILQTIPPERTNDVIVFDPGDIEKPLGLNMLEYDRSKPEQKTFIVNEMVNIFDRLYDLKSTGGPMFEQYMKNALILLMEDLTEPATLMEVPRIFSDKEYRNRKLSHATTPTVIDFWEKEAVKAGGDASLANITPYVTSKFNNFIANDYVRPIIGQQTSAFQFRDAMDAGKILLVNLSKGKIGDNNAGLIGMVVVGKILMAALSRVDVQQEQRQDFNLYIDEFQNFATDSISTILSEARKYRLNLVIAHQFIAQLPDNIRDAVFGNVGSILAFRVGADDAEFLEKQFAPAFSKSDLINIDNFNAYAKLLIRGQTSNPFNFKTIKPREGDPQIAAKLREYSRNTYGRNRGEVEQEILQRLRS